tara:strand:+ start:406 stop:564 length:159 start_codon:yes stop_codon:yes gene_type:complete
MKKYNQHIVLGVLLGLTILIPRAFTQLPQSEIQVEYMAAAGDENFDPIVLGE